MKNPFKIFWCRAFQTAFRIAHPFLPYREPEVLHSVCEAAEVLKDKGVCRVLIVTDVGIVGCGLVRPLEEALGQVGVDCVVYSGTQPNPTVDNVEQALLLWKDRECDALVAIGGGSAMDCAKALGARAVYPHKPLGKMGGVLRVRKRLHPLVAIPTTAGTGSEVTLAAVITDPDARRKYAIMSFPLIPHYAVLDPTLTRTLPPHLTASTGMDALTHAVEAYIGRSATRRTRRLALEAVRLIFENIERAYRCGDDLEARESMLVAAYSAGVAFSESYVGYIHALAHSLGGRYGTPHGLANAVIMPYVLEAYGKSAHKKLHRLALAAGVCDPADTHAEGARKFIGAVRELNSKMGIPARLGGIAPEDIPELARHAEGEANPLYPVPRLMTAVELEQIYYKFAADRG